MLNCQAKIILVEDEVVLGDTLKFNLETDGYEVQWFQDGLDAFEYFEHPSQDFHLVILDMMLPRKNGMEILQQIRKNDTQVPVIVLSAKNQEQDKVKALILGADDYVTKPFGLMELLARIQVHLRKSGWQPQENHKTFAGLSFIPEDYCLISSESLEPIRLSVLEVELIEYLLKNENKAVSRDDLLKNVWKIEASQNTRTVDMFMTKLRKYIGKEKESFILSVRGVGYLYATDEKVRALYKS